MAYPRSVQLIVVSEQVSSLFEKVGRYLEKKYWFRNMILQILTTSEHKNMVLFLFVYFFPSPVRCPRALHLDFFLVLLGILASSPEPLKSQQMPSGK